jgi:hypothetical protein
VSNECSSEQNDAFERLETLLSQLPTMQEKGNQLSRAREARRLLELQSYEQVLRQEYAGYKSIHADAMAAAHAASVQGDSAAEAREHGVVRGYAELMATRVAPLQRASQALSDALASSTLALDDPLKELSLDNATFAALEHEIATYQRDYQKTYEHCQEFNT